MSGSMYPALQADQPQTQIQNPLQLAQQAYQLKSAQNALSLFPLQQQQQQIATDAAQLKLTQSQNDATFGLLQGLNGKSYVSMGDLVDVGAQAAAMGLPTASYRAWLAQRAQSGQTNFQGDVSGQLARLAGPVAGSQLQRNEQGFTDDGRQRILTQTGAAIGPNPGQISTPGGQMNGGAIPNQLSPAQAGEYVITGYDANNRPIYTQRGAVPIPGGANAAPSPFGTGRPPPSLVNPNAPPPASGATPLPAAVAPGATSAAPPAAVAPPVAPPPVQTPGTSFTAPSTQQTAGQTAAGSASSDAFTKIRTDGDTAQGMQATLGNMLADSQQFTTGPEQLNQFRAMAQKYVPALGISDANKVAAQESFDKMANVIALQQGSQSDGRLAVAQHATPNSAMTPQGVQSIIHQLQGNADYLVAKRNLAATYPDKSNIDAFNSNVAKNLDPRVFQFQRMTDPERKAYVANLSPADQNTVATAYQYALDHGLITH